jgi:hypothetical protein
MNYNLLCLLGVAAISFGAATESSAATAGYWRFEEASGAAIASAGGRDGAVFGPTTARVASVPGSTVPQTGAPNTQSMSFTSQDDAVGMGLPDPLVPVDSLNIGTSDFTLEAWVYPTTTAGDFTHWIAGKAISGLFGDKGYGLSIAGHNRTPGADTFDIDFGAGADGVKFHYIEDLTGYQLNQWYHIAGVREGGLASLYVNGELVGAVESPTALPVNGNSTQEFTIGGARTGAVISGNSYTLPFGGLIDEVRLTIGTALTPIQFLNSPIPEPSSAILALVCSMSVLACRRRAA